MRTATTRAMGHAERPSSAGTESLKTILRLFGAVTVVLMLTFGPPILFGADDGPLTQRNLSRTPALHTEDAGIQVMWLYVPAQDTQGEPPDTPSGELEYYAGDCTSQDTSTCDLIYTRPEAKPLVASWLDGEVEFVGDLKFTGHGRRDAFVGLSLDDGATWKQYNVSRSGDLSSFTLRDGTDYPGDVIGISTAVEGNGVMVAWVSRYCTVGNPLHAWLPEDQLELASTYELGQNLTVDSVDYNTYASDLFGVSGPQGSSDFADEGYPEVGEVPYACLWAARGTLEQALDEKSGAPLFNSDGGAVYGITWRAAERITSGKRDVNLVQVASSPGAGFVLVWQEDPDGLRPGKGLCLDGGFNGAVAHNNTDIWYTYLDLDHFDDVCLDDPVDGLCLSGTLGDYTGDDKPKVAVPMAVPIRLTDNEACRAATATESDDPYCYADFNGDGTADFCATTEPWENSGGTTLEVCVADDGRPMTGRTFATRARLEMKSYDSDCDDSGCDGASDSAWLALIHERSKAMGTEIDPNTGDVIDIGKDVWYHTFEFDNPELVQQGLMLNAPALDPEDVLPFETFLDEWGYEHYETEIARHANLAANNTTAAMASESKTTAILIYKQGILNQGGPADVFMRRVVLPENFEPAVDNPFAYENVQCVAFDDTGVATPVDLLYDDGSNPTYVRGLCPVEGMNVSSTTLVRCSDGTSGEACADQFAWDDGEPDEFPKVLEWSQTVDNLNDPSWANPYEVSKDNQAFLDGDLLVLLYSTAPNWKASTIGKEAYNLYARRSFDGGQTWTVLPADYTHWSPLNPDVTITADGTETCEWYGGFTEDDYQVCDTYPPGEFEPERNLSQLAGTKVSVLEPRLAPSGGALKRDYTKLLCDYELDGIWANCGYTVAVYSEDIRAPSAFFVSYQTANIRVVDEDTGPAPLDMFYSRASNFGDDYDMQDLCDSDLDDPWYPSKPYSCEEGETDWRFDWLEYGKRSMSDGAQITATPDGSRLYAVWSQEDFDRQGDLVGSDAWWRRVFYNLDGEE